MTLSDAIKQRDAILRRIKGAKIGIGSNKPGWYDDPRHRAYGKARRRRAEWALALEVAKEDLAKFDAKAKQLEVIDPGEFHDAEMVEDVGRQGS